MKTLLLDTPKTEEDIDRYVYCRSVCPHRMEVCWHCHQFENGNWQRELRHWKNTKRREK